MGRREKGKRREAFGARYPVITRRTGRGGRDGMVGHGRGREGERVRGKIPCDRPRNAA